MFTPFPLFKVLGIQVVTNWTIIILCFVARTPAGALALVLTIFLHEMAHALAAKRSGANVHQIMIGLVGLATFSGRLRPLQSAWIAFAGPLINLVTAALAMALCGVDWEAVVHTFKSRGDMGNIVGSEIFIFLYEFGMNLAIWGFVLGLLNLIPALPLDGGWITQHLLETKLNKRRARIIALKCTLFSGVAMVVFAFVGSGVDVFFLVFGGYLVYVAYGEHKALTEFSEGAGMWQSFTENMSEKSEQRKYETAQKRQQEGAKNDKEIRARVDQLLVKISKEGMSKLTKEERDFLKNSSDHFK